MFDTKNLARNAALAGAVTLLLGSSAFAQNRVYTRTTTQAANGGYANRLVEGTVASVQHDRNGGDHVRLTNGMDLLVPVSITSMNQGRRYGAAMLQPGDVVRMNVYSREGDGRDAQVRSMEIVQSGSVRGRMNNTNNRQMNGTVVSVNRRARTLVMQTDRGRTLNVDFNSTTTNLNGGQNTARPGTFHRGDRISVSGRMDRNNGIVIADEVYLSR